MTNAYSVDDLLDFLDHASERGLMPAATAQALAVATRNVTGVLTEQERQDLGGQDLDAIIRRFNNRRARDFNPSSLKEYGRRVQRAVKLYLDWRKDPSSFTVATRTTGAARRRGSYAEMAADREEARTDPDLPPEPAGTYRSSFPVRPGVVVTLANIPIDLTRGEAQRLADFVKMLAVEA
jgi:hypothetical protein